MPPNLPPLNAIPTNLIMGFLGTGKTTSILHLVSQKPAHETWAILVNEFGRIGVDGSILAESNATVAEVPGGCLCCEAGPVFDVTLNRLLSEARPDRLLIEPTGIGHPRQIIHKLSHEPHSNVLDLKATICLVDPRHLAQEKYRQHEIFRDQIAYADILIANKTDVCNADDLLRFQAFASALEPKKHTITRISHGCMDSQYLDIDANRKRLTPDRAQSKNIITREPATHHPSPDGWVQTEHNADGFYSTSWSISRDVVFDLPLFQTWIQSLPLERIKAVIHTRSGWTLINGSSDAIDLTNTAAAEKTVVEIITTTPMSLSAINRLQQFRSD